MKDNKLDDQIENEVEHLVNEYLMNKKITRDFPNYMMIYYDTKKRLLKEIYNISWESPFEINQDTLIN